MTESSSPRELEAIVQWLRQVSMAGLLSVDAGELLLESGKALNKQRILEGVAAQPDSLRQLLEIRLGIDAYAGMSQSQRYQKFAEALDARAYKNLRRADSDAPLRSLATFLRAVERTSARVGRPEVLGPYDRWDVVEYESTRTFPTTSGGDLVVSHRRRIRSRVDGLEEFRIPQRSSGRADLIPDVHMTTGGEAFIENIQDFVEHNGAPGVRYDFVVKFKPIRLGEIREIGWIWTKTLTEEDGIYRRGDRSHLSLTPHLLIEKATLRFVFRSAHPPGAVWSFADVPDMDRLGSHPIRTPLPVVDGVAEAVFDRPAVGYAYGITCEWD